VTTTNKSHRVALWSANRIKQIKQIIADMNSGKPQLNEVELGYLSWHERAEVSKGALTVDEVRTRIAACEAAMAVGKSATQQCLAAKGLPLDTVIKLG
jgi:hypothetical protein